eukprot:6178729-Pleurochrysis_carterae.AAC.1
MRARKYAVWSCVALIAVCLKPLLAIGLFKQPSLSPPPLWSHPPPLLYAYACAARAAAAAPMTSAQSSRHGAVQSRWP